MISEAQKGPISLLSSFSDLSQTLKSPPSGLSAFELNIALPSNVLENASLPWAMES